MESGETLYHVMCKKVFNGKYLCWTISPLYSVMNSYLMIKNRIYCTSLLLVHVKIIYLIRNTVWYTHICTYISHRLIWWLHDKNNSSCYLWVLHTGISLHSMCPFMLIGWPKYSSGIFFLLQSFYSVFHSIYYVIY